MGMLNDSWICCTSKSFYRIKTTTFFSFRESQFFHLNFFHLQNFHLQNTNKCHKKWAFFGWKNNMFSNRTFDAIFEILKRDLKMRILQMAKERHFQILSQISTFVQKNTNKCHKKWAFFSIQNTKIFQNALLMPFLKLWKEILKWGYSKWQKRDIFLAKSTDPLKTHFWSTFWKFEKRS